MKIFRIWNQNIVITHQFLSLKIRDSECKISQGETLSEMLMVTNVHDRCDDKKRCETSWLDLKFTLQAQSGWQLSVLTNINHNTADWQPAGLLQNKTAENISSLRQKYFSEKCAVSGCCKTVISKEEWVDEEICCLTGNLGQQQRIC